LWEWFGVIFLAKKANMYVYKSRYLFHEYFTSIEQSYKFKPEKARERAPNFGSGIEKWR